MCRKSATRRITDRNLSDSLPRGGVNRLPSWPPIFCHVSVERQFISVLCLSILTLLFVCRKCLMVAIPKGTTKGGGRRGWRSEWSSGTNKLRTWPGRGAKAKSYMFYKRTNERVSSKYLLLVLFHIIIIISSCSIRDSSYVLRFG